MGDYPRVRVYGQFTGNDSWSRVAAGMALGLSSNGALADTCPIRDAFDGATLETGANAEVAIYVGSPECVGVLRKAGEHRERLAFVAANSSWLPPEMMRDICRCATGIVAPSTWSQQVVWNQGAGLACYLWQHGVDDVFAPSPGPVWEPPHWTVLHMASTSMERKSTKLLIEAWSACMMKGYFRDAKLVLVLSGDKQSVARKVFEESKRCGGRILDNVRITSRKNMTSWRASAFYKQFSMVCQPSRSEGFGLVPLEARACGIPVVMTGCSGHADHVDGPGVERVVHRRDWADIDDGPGAEAPLVETDDIANALMHAYDNRHELTHDARLHAEVIRAQWSWPEVTKRWLRSMFYAG
jgi:glycosyltransferase involved in cell wall biosynthesis